MLQNVVENQSAFSDIICIYEYMQIKVTYSKLLTVTDA